jgi:hypothetical protein
MTLCIYFICTTLGEEDFHHSSKSLLFNETESGDSGR